MSAFSTCMAEGPALKDGHVGLTKENYYNHMGHMDQHNNNKNQFRMTLSLCNNREANYYRELVSMEGLDGYVDKEELQHVVLEKRMYKRACLANSDRTHTNTSTGN